MHSEISLFIFAHQDDEFGVYSEIDRCVKRGKKVIVIYLTSGNGVGEKSPRRDAESLSVLEKLGVPREHVYFLGSDLRVPDGKLVEHLQVCYDAVINLLSEIGSPQQIYFLAWEGGHQDHDAAHLIGAALGLYFDILENCLQFPLYTGIGLRGSLFRLFVPIAENGPVIIRKISWANRFRFVRYSLSYPSQMRTWIGLFPFLLLHYIFFGTQIFQKISVSRLQKKPHPGSVLYARRGFYTEKKFSDNANEFLQDKVFLNRIKNF